MDPTSLTASIITIVGLADKIISVCKGYITTVKDAPNDLTNILIEVGSVKCVIEIIQLRNDNSVIGTKLQSTGGPLEGCKQALIALNKLLEIATDCPVDGKRGKRRKLALSYATLAWPLKEGKAQKLLTDIARHKATISLALTTETAQHVQNVSNKVEHLRDTLTDVQRESILSWLVTSDPSPLHNKACDLHEPETSHWLTRSTEYKDWRSGSTRFLWLHGIPGAGKTVLASFVIQDIQSLCGSSTRSDGWAYYYCYFGRAQDETPHLLRWIINQLCRQSQYVPDEVGALYRQGGEPRIASLLFALSAVLRNFRQVYIVLDALDESKDRQILLQRLTAIARNDNFHKIRIVAVSRKERDIEEALKGIFVDISLSNPLFDKDIRMHIQSQLSGNSRFRHWSKTLTQEVELALVEGAKGMFRWVECQLDILGRLHSAPEIRKALRELPETLDETYERVLTAIPTCSRVIAHKTLQFLAFHEEDFRTLAVLAEAVVVDVDQLCFNPDNRLLSEEELLEACTCLINRGYDEYDEENVTLAHYTVREYLTSERIKQGDASAFAVSQAASNALTSKTAITYLLSVAHEELPQLEDLSDMSGDEELELEDIFPLLSIAAEVWNLHKQFMTDRDRAVINNLVLQLLDPQKPHLAVFLQQRIKHTELGGSCPSTLPLWNCLPGVESSFTLAYACYCNMIDAARTFLAQNPNCNLEKQVKLITTYGESKMYAHKNDLEGATPFQVALKLKNVDFMRLFLEHGASIAAGAESGSPALVSALQFDPLESGYYTDTSSTVELLLDEGEPVNHPWVMMTPLQAALCYTSEILSTNERSDVIQMLLDAGADVNAVGNDAAVVAHIRCQCLDSKLKKMEDRMYTRGKGDNYRTPLRLLEDIFSWGSIPSRSYRAIKNRLIELGAKSLHLFPVKGLPGYNEADMQAFAHMARATGAPDPRRIAIESLLIAPPSRQRCRANKPK